MAGLLENLSKDEQEIFTQALQQTRQKKIDLSQSKQIREIIPIEKWINSPYYVGRDGAKLYDFWKEEMIDIFGENRGKYNEVVVTGSLGCLCEKTRVPTTIGNLTLKELDKRFNNGERFKVLSEDGLNEVYGVKDNGYTDTIKITTKQGRVVEGTPNHRFRVVVDGEIKWKRFDELEKSDKLVMTRQESPFGGIDEDKDIAYTLGYITGDGWTSINSTNQNRSKNMLGVLFQKGSNVGDRLRVGMNKFCGYYIEGEDSSKNTVMIMLRANNEDLVTQLLSEGLGSGAREKDIIERVYSWNKESMSEYIKGLFDADGTVGKSNIAITMASKNIIYNLADLLSMYGINYHITEKIMNNNDFRAWRLSIVNRRSWEIFRDEIGFDIDHKKEKLNDLCVFKGYTNVRMIIPDSNKVLNGMMNQDKIKGYTKNRNLFSWYRTEQRVTLETVKRLYKIYPEWISQSDYLKYIIEKDVFFDEVSSVEKSKSYTRDLAVKNSPTYSLKGFISHNTGKSTFALFCMLRKLYELSCYENIAGLFDLMSTSFIVFIYFSVNRTQAELTGFGQFRELVDSIDYFREEFERNEKLNSLLKFPENVLFTHGSSTEHAIGMNMIGAILDEANFFKGEERNPSKSTNQAYSKIAELYSSIVNRGKCVVGDTRVQTELGYKKIKDIYENPAEGFNECNIKVSSRYGELETSHFYYQKDCKVNHLVLSNGREINGTDTHGVLSLNNRGVPELVNIEELTPGDKILYSHNENHWETSADNGLSDIHNYMLGLYLGDGSSTKRIRKNGDIKYTKVLLGLKDTLEIIKNHFGFNSKISYHKGTYRMEIPVSRLNLINDYIGNENSYDKKVPEIIYEGSRKQKMLFLLGVIDSDGTVRNDCMNISITSASEKLSDGIMDIADSIGIHFNKTERILKSGKYKGNKYYRLIANSWTLYNLLGIDNIGAGYKLNNIKENFTDRKFSSNQIPNKVLIGNYDELIELNREEKSRILTYVLSDGNTGRSNTTTEFAFRKMVNNMDNYPEYFEDIMGYSYFTIKDIYYTKEDVYDLTVPEKHEFMAQGLANHNSRFMDKNEDHSLSILVSSATHSSSFTQKRIEMAANDPHTKIIDSKLWEVKPDKYSDETFWVFAGSELLDPFIIRDVTDVNKFLESIEQDLINPEYNSVDFAVNQVPVQYQEHFVEVPVDFRKSFENELISALQDIAGVSIAPMGRLFTSRPTLNAACQRGAQKGLKHPFYKDEFEVPTNSDIKMQDFLRDGFVFQNRHKPRYVHIDQSTTTDSTGMSMVHIDEVKEIDGVKKTFVNVDFMIRINPPKPPKEISIGKIRDFVFYMRDEMDVNIKKVSYDWFGCLSAGHRVPTEKGILNIEDIKVGDKVLTEEGYREVNQTFSYDDAEVIKVITKSGRSIEGTVNHEIKVWKKWNYSKSKRQAVWEWKRLDEIEEDDIVYTEMLDADKKDYVELIGGGQKIGNGHGKIDGTVLPEYLDEDLAYIIGYYLGDGRLTGDGFKFSYNKGEFNKFNERVKRCFNYDMELHEREVEGKDERVYIKRTSSLSSRDLVRFLEKNGVVGCDGLDKKIPEIIWKSPKSVIASFSAGLIDSDGSVDKKGSSGEGRVQFTNHSEDLIYGFQNLLMMGLGIKSTISEVDNSKYNDSGLVRNCSEIGYRLKTVGERTKLHDIPSWKIQENLSDIKGRNIFDRVSKIESDKKDVYDIEVEDEHAYYSNGFYSHNSSESRQVLAEEGIEAEHFSVDKNDESYLTLVRLLFEERIDLYKYDVFANELFDLIHDRNKRKVDHPPGGHNDVSDSLAGAVMGALGDNSSESTSNDDSGVVAELNRAPNDDAQEMFDGMFDDLMGGF